MKTLNTVAAILNVQNEGFVDDIIKIGDKSKFERAAYEPVTNPTF